MGRSDKRTKEAIIQAVDDMIEIIEGNKTSPYLKQEDIDALEKATTVLYFYSKRMERGARHGMEL